MLGCLYALIAVGYTMVYGIIELINFAFGELFMLGAYVSIMMMVSKITLFGHEVAMPALNFFLAVPIAMAVVAILGVVIEGLAYRPLRNAPRLAALISAIGVSILLQNVAQAIFGSQQASFPTIPLFTTAEGQAKSFEVGGAISHLVPGVRGGGHDHRHDRSQPLRQPDQDGAGHAASAQDKRTSALMGVNVNWVIAITFLIGSAMGALGGASTVPCITSPRLRWALLRASRPLSPPSSGASATFQGRSSAECSWVSSSRSEPRT